MASPEKQIGVTDCGDRQQRRPATFEEALKLVEAARTPTEVARAQNEVDNYSWHFDLQAKQTGNG